MEQLKAIIDMANNFLLSWKGNQSLLTALESKKQEVIKYKNTPGLISPGTLDLAIFLEEVVLEIKILENADNQAIQSLREKIQSLKQQNTEAAARAKKRLSERNIRDEDEFNQALDKLDI